MNTETDGGVCIKVAVSALEAQILEILRSSRSVPDPETARDAHENESAARQMVIAEAQTEIAAMKSRQNELLPIHRLPAEVLSIILSMALPVKRHHKERTKLLLVCRAWFSIINENPSTFWATLSAEDPVTQRARLLQKAGQMPMTIVMGSHYGGDNAAEDFLKYIKSNDIPFHELIVHEWRDTGMEAVFANCLTAPAPQLRSLDLEFGLGWVRGGEDPNSQQFEMLSGVAPSLKSVRLCGVSIPWNSAILRNLLSLTLEFPDNRAGVIPSVEQILGILRSCPSLQSLRLGYMDFPRSMPLPPLSLDRLTTIDLSTFYFEDIFSLLRHIQFPKTAAVALAMIGVFPDDADGAILNATLHLLQQRLSIKSFHVAIDEWLVRFSTTRLKLSIANRVQWNRYNDYYITYKDFFFRLDSSIRTAITSLHLEFLKSENSTALDAVNETIASLTGLSVDHSHSPKSEKPSNGVSEDVVKTSEDRGPLTWNCPNLRSLEITVANLNSLDLTEVLELVRTRKSDVQLRGKQVTKSPITTIRLAFQSGYLSSGQTELLNELKSEVADVECVMLPETDEASDLPSSSEASDSSDSD